MSILTKDMTAAKYSSPLKQFGGTKTPLQVLPPSGSASSVKEYPSLLM